MVFDIEKVNIFVTVPKENVDEVRKAMCDAGAGIIGNYTYCTCAINSIGTFIPNEKANPHVGEKQKIDFVDEVKLEVVCEVKNVRNVISELKKVHPYEEPVISIVPLLNEKDF